MDIETKVSKIEHERQPGDSVRIVLFDAIEPSKFLVVAESDDPTNFKLTGGSFEDNDSDEQACANRELLEELGLLPADIDLKFSEKLPNDDGVSARYIYYGFIKP